MISAEREHLGGNQAIRIRGTMRISGLEDSTLSSGVEIFKEFIQFNKCAERFKQNKWGGELDQEERSVL